MKQKTLLSPACDKSLRSAGRILNFPDPSHPDLIAIHLRSRLCLEAISIFAVPVVVMGVFGAALKVPWARPEKDSVVAAGTVFVDHGLLQPVAGP